MKIYIKKIFLKRKLNKIFSRALEMTDNVIPNVSVGVKFVSGEEIKNLNNQFRGVDKVTDVLSFPMLNIKAGQKIVSVIDEFDQIDGEIYLGDIVICKEKINSQAKEFGHSKKRELCYLALHSFLHLLGYDHMTADEEKEMFDLAEKIIGYGR